MMDSFLEFYLAGHGGYRDGSGRKAEYGNRQQPVAVFLTSDQYDFLNGLEHDTVSEAVRSIWEELRYADIQPRRVRMSGGRRVHTSITLPKMIRDDLKRLGRGKVSSGLRLLIQVKQGLTNEED